MKKKFDFAIVRNTDRNNLVSQFFALEIYAYGINPYLLRKGIVIPVIVAIVIIAIFLNMLYGIQNLEYGVVGIGLVTPTTMDLEVGDCNPYFIPVGIDEMRADLKENSATIGTLSVKGNTIPANSGSTMGGTITFADTNSAKRFVDGLLDNSTTPDFTTTIFVKATVGPIPYSYQKDYDFNAFSKFLFSNTKLSCKSGQGTLSNDNLRSDLELAKSRFYAANLLYANKEIAGFNGTQNENGSNSAVP